VKLSFSSNAFTKYSVLEAIEKIAAIGYDGVEILADQPHLFAASIDHDDLARLSQSIKLQGIAIANINANTAAGYYGQSFWEPLFEPSLANPDPEARQWRIKYTINSIDIAQALGAETISITSGRPIPGTIPDQSLTLLEDSLTEIIDYAKKKAVKIGIEYEPGLLISNSVDLAAFLDIIDSPWLGANLDIGHCVVAGETITESIHRLSNRIFHIHLEDIKGREHYHLIPGTGDIDFESVLESLDKQGYSGYASVELYTFPDNPEQAALQSFQYLNKLPYWHTQE